MNRATIYHRSDKIIKIRPTQLPADLSETRTHGSLELLSLRRGGERERERERERQRAVIHAGIRLSRRWRGSIKKKKKKKQRIRMPRIRIIQTFDHRRVTCRANSTIDTHTPRMRVQSGESSRAKRPLEIAVRSSSNRAAAWPDVKATESVTTTYASSAIRSAGAKRYVCIFNLAVARTWHGLCTPGRIIMRARA